MFDYSGDLYGRHLRVALLDFLRPELKFPGLDELKAQIAADCEQARQFLAHYQGPKPGPLGAGSFVLQHSTYAPVPEAVQAAFVREFSREDNED